MDDTRDAYLDEVLIGGREHVAIRIVDYDEQWPRRFEVSAERVRRVLGGKALSVEHIGSTSVPGLAAKPIVDMLLTVADVTDEAAYVPMLESIGFVLRVREPGHRMLRTVGRDTHLHVYKPDRAEVRDYLDLRDWLRDAEDPALYAAEKRRLAEQQWRDMNDYADAKTDIIRTRARSGAPGPEDTATRLVSGPSDSGIDYRGHRVPRPKFSPKIRQGGYARAVATATSTAATASPQDMPRASLEGQDLASPAGIAACDLREGRQPRTTWTPLASTPHVTREASTASRDTFIGNACSRPRRPLFDHRGLTAASHVAAPQRRSHRATNTRDWRPSSGPDDAGSSPYSLLVLAPFVTAAGGSGEERPRQTGLVARVRAQRCSS